MKTRVLLAITAVLCLARVAAGQSGVLKVTSFPSGAEVLIDGVPSGKVTPMSSALPLGDHTVEVRIPSGGWRADTRTVTIVAGNNDLSVTLLPSLIAGPQGPQGPAGPQGPQGERGPAGSGGLLVVDSLGRTVGPYLNFQGDDFVLLTIHDVTLRIVVRPDGLNQSNERGGDYGFAYWYETPDCTGTRYYPALNVGFTRPAGVLGTQVMFAQSPFMGLQIRSREVYLPGSDPRSPGLCEDTSFIGRVGLAETADISHVPNSPPLSIR